MPYRIHLENSFKTWNFACEGETLSIEIIWNYFNVIFVTSFNTWSLVTPIHVSWWYHNENFLSKFWYDWVSCQFKF